LADLDLKKVREYAQSLCDQFGVERAVAVRMDVTSEAEVIAAFESAIRYYGGLDLVVSNAGIAHISPVEKLHLKDWEKNMDVNATGHFLVSREAMKIFRKQGMGGNLIFNATKNVSAPGKHFVAYSASKSAEAQLARICAIEGGEMGVRANMVNPDGIFDGSGLWSDKVRKSRAKTYGIRENQLQDFYRKRNLLQVAVTSHDVAKTVSFLASEESSCTTGCMITVDGGVKEAFPR